MSEDKYQKISEKNTKQITLSLPEILFIDDHISLMIDASDFENMMPLRPSVPSSLMIVTIEFIDKIGRAFIEVLEKGTRATTTIPISEMELYMLREICFSRVDYFGYKVGMSLKKKVLSALYANDRKQQNLLEQLLKDIDLGDKS
tara:strand:+ start:546 stop:980 length:435 start_codon:yes stop_codon:yes gene_type:complete